MHMFLNLHLLHVLLLYYCHVVASCCSCGSRCTLGVLKKDPTNYMYRSQALLYLSIFSTSTSRDRNVGYMAASVTP
jgi:hypothetical protein